MPIWHQSPKLTPRYFLETPRLFGYPLHTLSIKTQCENIINNLQFVQNLHR